MAPSTVHESLLLWLRDDPSQLSTLLGLLGHEPCPTTLTVEDSALRVAFPVEVTPDLVLCDPGSRRWVLVEVQRQPDEDKARRWPLAMSAMADRHGPDGELVVITPSIAVARWAATIASHHRGGTRWGVAPTVLRLGSPEADAMLTRGPPELAVFAAWVMQGRWGARAVAVVRRAMERAGEIRDERLRQSMQRGILAISHPSVVEKLRSTEMIDIDQLPYNPALERWEEDVMKRRGARLQAESEARGEARGEALMLLRILRRRGLEVSSATEARLLATTETALLERWADRALDAASIEAVFAEP